MGRSGISHMAASSPQGVGVAAALLMLATVAALGGDVLTLDDDSMLGHELGSGLSNSTNATAMAQEIKEPEEKKPSTAEEAELESYKHKVREIEQQKGGNPTEGEVTMMAQQLMELDKASKKSAREREIEQKLRQDGPKETRVEVDPKHWESEAEERRQREVAKRKEEELQEERKDEQETARANEAQAVTEMLERYTQETMDPALEKKIQSASNEFKQASKLEKRLKPPADGPDPYGVHDRSSYAAPEKNAQANSTVAETTDDDGAD